MSAKQQQFINSSCTYTVWHTKTQTN